MNRFDQAIKDAGLTLPDKSDPRYRAIFITEAMRQANFRDYVFESDRYAAIIIAVFDQIQAGADDVQASATACILMRPSKMRDAAASGKLPTEPDQNVEVASDGAEANNEGSEP